MKGKKEIIGFTIGVFDLFHIGHLNILKKAKSMCDKLIVAVSTDKFVEKYKNKKPIIPYKERIEIIKSIKYVDKVIPQNTLDREKFWQKSHFDIIFHGNDLKKDPVRFKLENELQKKHNVKLVYFPYTKTTSSTLLTETLKKINKK